MELLKIFRIFLIVFATECGCDSNLISMEKSLPTVPPVPSLLTGGNTVLNANILTTYPFWKQPPSSNYIGSYFQNNPPFNPYTTTTFKPNPLNPFFASTILDLNPPITSTTTKPEVPVTTTNHFIAFETPKPTINPLNPFLNANNNNAGKPTPSVATAGENPTVLPPTNLFSASTNPNLPSSFETTQTPSTLHAINSQNPFLNASPQPDLLHNVETTTNAPIAPSGDCLKARGQFPSDTCNTFVNCWDNLAVEQHCPSGLMFNPIGYCDYAFNVNCKGKRIAALPGEENKMNFPSTQATITSTQDHTKDVQLRKYCQSPRGQFPMEICNKYVNCWDHGVAVQDCPPGLLFSEQGYCDFPENVNCHNRKTIQVNNELPINSIDVAAPPPGINRDIEIFDDSPTDGTTKNYADATTTVSGGKSPDINRNGIDLRGKCLQPRGQFPAEACNKYINCWDDTITEVECPAGLLFSEKGYCDYPQNVQCGDRTMNYQEIPKPQSDQCPVPHGTFRDKDNCKKYYTCIDSAIVSQYECPVGFSFNDLIGVCDYEYRVDCASEPLIYFPKRHQFLNNLARHFSTLSHNCKEGIVYPLTPDCTSVAICKAHGSEIIHCPAGLAYDVVADKCVQFAQTKWYKTKICLQPPRICGRILKMIDELISFIFCTFLIVYQQ